ncbi:hypothetical protein [Haloarchaeobius sp. HRN-SO-5]|uniref:hypothetical protein n=1 Tax=Haloarchaeobius sp. HRN-SO-5 TaxID=3446118 RepID=UPI003EB8ACF3
MATRSFPQSFRQRLRWAIRESLLIAGIFLFWVGVGLVLMAVLSIVAFLIRTARLDSLRFVYEFARRSAFVWTVLTPPATATAGLYVLVRAGTILLDRYQSPPAPDE